MPLPMIDAGVERASTRAPEAENARLPRRFDRAARLVSEPGLRRLMDARVLVIGVGGVGSFAAEALARSAVGALALIDFDDVCVTNANRQLHALRGTIGQPKVQVMAERLALVNPAATIEPVQEFYSADSSERLLGGKVDFVIDAIDNLTAKAHLLATCLARSIPVVSSMGAAARLDPTMIRTADLADTRRDPFARALRKILRKEHGLTIEPGRPIGITAIYSEEEALEPAVLSYDGENGFLCVCPNKSNGQHTCDARRRIDGSAAFVTGAFGLAAAGVVVRALSARG
ncbi:MAG: ThiF family adenylyltransferase [Sandaracinaceae bacterium]